MTIRWRDDRPTAGTVAMLADQNLDAVFVALWSDPERNALEAALDRRSDDEIDAGAGAGFRGSADELLSAVQRLDP